MTQTPLDRLKLASFLIAQWSAFLNAFLLLCGLFLVGIGYEQPPQWYKLIFDFYQDGFKALGLYGTAAEFAMFAYSPAVWLILWIATGSPSILPWEKRPK